MDLTARILQAALHLVGVQFGPVIPVGFPNWVDCLTAGTHGCAKLPVEGCIRVCPHKQAANSIFPKGLIACVVA